MNLNKRFEVAFNNDFENYEDLVLKPYHKYINTVYFAPPVEVASNARPFSKQVNVEELVKFIGVLKSYDIKAMIVLNGSWMPLTVYTNEWFSQVVSALKPMYDAGLWGVTLQNNYIMNSGIFKDYLPNLKVISSVNQMIDSTNKAIGLLDMLPYDGLMWDRSLNNNQALLQAYNEAVKHAKPDTQTYVLLNEGCLLHCPFKKDHDNCIGMLSYTDEDLNEYNKKIFTKHTDLNGTLNNLNWLFGCQKMYAKNPDLLKSSPFIRPEKLEDYDGCADIFKIAGRTQSTEWIARAVKAYTEQKYDGYVNDYLDSMSRHSTKLK